MKKILSLVIAFTLLLATYSGATDQRIQSSERMVGAGHATRTDTLNRLTLIEHNNDGTHDKLTQITDPYVDIRAYLPNGYVTDGSVNYSTEIIAAVDVVEAAGGGDVYLPCGTWRIDAFIPYSQDLHFIGSGQCTIIDNRSGDYAFKQVMTAHGGFVTFEKMKIIGTNDVTAQGGIYIGDPSGGSFFPGQYAIRDVKIDNFQKSGAIGVYLENPSDVSFDNVKIGSIGSGTALVIRGTRVNTGVFVFNDSVFGSGTTDIGAEIGRSGDAGPIDSVAFNGSFFKGTTTAVKLFTRTTTFNGSHFEVGSGAAQHILVDNWLGGFVKGCTFGGNGTDPDYGVYVPSGDQILGVEISNNEFNSLLAAGAAVKVDATGSLVGNVLVSNNWTISTHPAMLDDASGNVQLKQIYDTDNSDNSTSGTGQDNLAVTTILAGYLGVQGGVKIEAAGTKTNGSAEAKTIYLRIDNAAITVLSAVTTATDWKFEAVIVNTATNAQRISWVFHDGVTVTQGYHTTTEDTTADFGIKLTGLVGGTGTDIITQTMWNIESL